MPGKSSSWFSGWFSKKKKRSRSGSPSRRSNASSTRSNARTRSPNSRNAALAAYLRSTTATGNNYNLVRYRTRAGNNNFKRR
jgi:hypothetical protein